MTKLYAVSAQRPSARRIAREAVQRHKNAAERHSEATEKHSTLPPPWRIEIHGEVVGKRLDVDRLVRGATFQIKK